MRKILIFVAIIIVLISACGKATLEIPGTTRVTPPPATITPTAPTNTATATLPIITASPTTPPLSGDMAVISAANAQDVDKITVLTGHTNRVTDLVFSGDGALLASTGYENKIHLWDVSTWKEVYKFPISEADLNVIAFSPDGSLLASGQAIWNAATKEIVQTLQERLVEPSHVAFSPDGSQIVVVANRKIRVLDVASGNEVLAFDVPAESRWLFGIAYSPDGKWLAASSGANGTVYFWSAETGELAFTLEQGNEHDVHDLAFTPDGRFLATGGTDYFARIWDVATGGELQKMPLIGMYSLALSPDGTLLATAGPDRAVKLWEVQSGKMLRSLPHRDELMAVAFSPDGRLIAAGGYDNTIVIWGISP